MFIIPLIILIIASLIALVIVWAYASEEGAGAAIAAFITSAVILAFPWFMFGYSMSYANVSNTRTCQVTEVVKVNELEQSTNGARVYCADGSNYEISDNFMTGRFDSSNVYNRVKAATGKEIVVDTIGFRNGFFSSFENIVEVKEVK